MINIRKLENELWEAADALRAGSKLTSNQYCMPVLGLIFLRYAYSRFKLVEAEILKDRPVRNGRVMPVEASDFKAKSALYLPVEAQYDYLLNLPEDIKGSALTSKDGQIMTREQLAVKIWGFESEAEYNNVEVCMSFTRKKLAFVGSKVEIKAVRGLGYELREKDV